MEVYATDIRDINPELSRFQSISSLLNILVPLLLSVGALLFLITLLYATFIIITAGGDPEKFKKAKTMFAYAIIGMLLLAASFLVTRLISFFFNVQVPI
jgi:hypothetical protein